LPEGSTAIEKGDVPAWTSAGVMALSFPSASMLYCDTLASLWFATYAYWPEGWTTTERGCSPAATEGGVIALRVPSAAMTYCKTLSEFSLAT
jgi:hypothetical protein